MSRGTDVILVVTRKKHCVTSLAGEGIGREKGNRAREKEKEAPAASPSELAHCLFHLTPNESNVPEGVGDGEGVLT